MLANYFKIGFRILLRNITYSLINILGLTIGLSSSIVIYLHVQHELSFDRFHNDSDHIYRFVMLEEHNGSVIEHLICKSALAPTLKNEFPEVEQVVRIASNEITITSENRVFLNNDLLYVDNDFFNMFTFPLIEGNPDLILKETNSAILSNSFAKKLFADTNPIGKTITSVKGAAYIVRGIAEDPPSNTKFKFDMISPMLRYIGDENRFGWGNGPGFETFVKLKKNIRPETLESKFAPLFKKYLDKDGVTGYLQSVKDMYLHSSKILYNIDVQADKNLLLFAFISFFILLIAIINYVNLSTSRSISRAKEVGIKKVFGVGRIALVWQFFIESFIIVFISIFISLILIEIFLPSINNTFDYHLSLYNHKNQYLFLVLFLFFIVVGSLSAFYPALFLSSFKPVKVLKGALSAKRKSSLRMGLVAFQFIISSVLISCTVYSIQQLNYTKNKEQGFNRKNLLSVKLGTKTLSQKYKTIKNEISSLSGVLNVAAASQRIGNQFDGFYSEDEYIIRILGVDPDYIETMGMRVIEGRGFSKELITDEEKYVINKTFVDKMNWDKAVGKKIETDAGKFEVIGVIDDFHNESLKSGIEPLILINQKMHGYHHLYIRLAENINSGRICSEIEKIVKGVDSSSPVQFTIMDDQYKNVYRSEIKLGSLFQLFSILAIFIACMGLFGLAAFTAEQRTKEFGIRKVLGARPKQLLGLLSKQYYIIIFFANIIALPITVFLLQRWQNEYAYHVNISITLFMVTFLVSVIIATIIIYVQSVKTALMNPVDTLKYE